MMDFIRCRTEDLAEFPEGFVWVYEGPAPQEGEERVVGGPFADLSAAVIDSGINASPEKISDDLYRYTEPELEPV